MNEEIQVPELNPSPPPEINPDYSPLLQYINVTNQLDKAWNDLKNNLKSLLYVPIVGWVLYGILYTIFFLFYGMLWIIGTVFESVYNTIVDIVNVVYIWFNNFQKAAKERYNGDYAKAIIDIVVKVILMYALEYALNIPFVKQLWDIFVSIVDRINRWLVGLKNWISTIFENITGYVNNIGSQITPLIRYIFRDEISFWTNQITTLVNDVRSVIMRRINEVDNKLTGWAENVINYVNSLRSEYERLSRDISDFIRTMRGLFAAYVEITMGSPLTITLYENKSKEKILVQYTIGPSQIDATYTTYDKDNDDYIVNVTEIIKDFVTELFDEESESHKKAEEIALATLSVIDDIINEIPVKYSVREVLNHYNKGLEEMSNTFAEMEAAAKTFEGRKK